MTAWFAVVVAAHLLACSVPVGARDVLPWFDLEKVPGPVGQSLREARSRSCGPPATGLLPFPVPAHSRLVFLSCDGGPYACPGRALQLREAGAPGLACPRDPGGRELATLHLVSRVSPDVVIGWYASRLGDGFAELAPSSGGERAQTQVERVFLQALKSVPERPWAPKRMHLQVSPAKGVLRTGGFLSQVRVTLSYGPFHGAGVTSSCAAPRGLRFGYDQRERGTLGTGDPAPSWCLVRRPGRAPTVDQR